MQNPYLEQAIDFIAKNDLKALPAGETVIEAGRLWVIIIDADLRKKEEAKYEAHNEYIDIHVPLSCPESYGVKDRKNCALPVAGLNAENDCVFFNDEISEIKTIEPGDKIIFHSDTAHAPLIGTGTIHKAIFKVKVVK